MDGNTCAHGSQVFTSSSSCCPRLKVFHDPSLLILVLATTGCKELQSPRRLWANLAGPITSGSLLRESSEVQLVARLGHAASRCRAINAITARVAWAWLGKLY